MEEFNILNKIFPGDVIISDDNIIVKNESDTLCINIKFHIGVIWDRRSDGFNFVLQICKIIEYFGDGIFNHLETKSEDDIPQRPGLFRYTANLTSCQPEYCMVNIYNKIKGDGCYRKYWNFIDLNDQHEVNKIFEQL